MEPVKFDVASRGHVLSWLDIVVNIDHIDGDCIDLAPRPFLTPLDWSSSPCSLGAYVLGRVSRWAEIKMSLQQLVCHASRLVVDLRRCGWRMRQFRHVLHSVQGKSDSMEMQLLRSVLSTAAKAVQ